MSRSSLPAWTCGEARATRPSLTQARRAPGRDHGACRAGELGARAVPGPAARRERP